MASPLSGIRVVDVTMALAAPTCAALMADLGADVIKVEPPAGEKFRSFVTKVSGSDLTLHANYSFQLANRGKRSLGLDLARPGGLDLLHRLIATADIFITNLVPSRQERYRLTFDDVKTTKPDIVYAFLSGYGSQGPSRNKLAFDISAYWANGGIMSLIGEPDGTPPLGRGGFGDYHTANALLAATLAALRLRDQTGEPQMAEVSLINIGLWGTGSDVQTALVTGVAPQAVSRLEPNNPIWNSYRCADGRWVVLVNTRPYPDVWPRFCRMIGRPEWADEGGYTDLAAIMAASRSIVAELDAIFPTRTRDEWAATMDDFQIIWAPVADTNEAIHQPDIEAMSWFAELESPELGRFRVLDTPFKVWGSDVGARGPAPRPGEHTFDVMAELGLSEAEVDALAMSGVIG